MTATITSTSILRRPLASSASATGMTLGAHASTTGGNPLAMAIGNAVLDIVFEPGFMLGVRERAAVLRQKLQHLVDTEGSGMFTEVRGLGLMLGLSCRVPSRRFVEAARWNKSLMGSRPRCLATLEGKPRDQPVAFCGTRRLPLYPRVAAGPPATTRAARSCGR